jgi:SMODS and SLOG-associating 2TM effector domain 1/Protein of unknown function (DUF4231)
MEDLPITQLFRNPALEDAWQRFGKYDKNATIAQKRFIYQRKLILTLGVAATTIAVLYSEIENYVNTDPAWIPVWVNQALALELLHIFVVVIPIVSGVLAAGTVKFNMGISWVMLRSSAEALKKEIYRYRTQVDEYSPARTQTESRDVELARKVKIISKRLMETQVNQTGLEPYKGDLPPLYGTADGDDGFSDLTADQYVSYRIEDQFSYYQRKAVRLSQELQQFQWFVYILGGVGTLLAAFGFDVWIAISSAMAAAFAGFLEFKRVETNVVSCNMAAADLYDIRVWWRALSDNAKAHQGNIETLVSSTESVIQSENAGWVQEMRDALADIYGDQEQEEESGEAAADDETPAPPILADQPQPALPPAASPKPAAPSEPTIEPEEAVV